MQMEMDEGGVADMVDSVFAGMPTAVGNGAGKKKGTHAAAAVPRRSEEVRIELMNGFLDHVAKDG